MKINESVILQDSISESDDHKLFSLVLSEFSDGSIVATRTLHMESGDQEIECFTVAPDLYLELQQFLLILFSECDLFEVTLKRFMCLGSRDNKSASLSTM